MNGTLSTKLRRAFSVSLAARASCQARVGVPVKVDDTSEGQLPEKLATGRQGQLAQHRRARFHALERPHEIDRHGHVDRAAGPNPCPLALAGSLVHRRFFPSGPGARIVWPRLLLGQAGPAKQLHQHEPIAFSL